jgi:hypothetical protein
LQIGSKEYPEKAGFWTSHTLVHAEGNDSDDLINLKNLRNSSFLAKAPIGEILSSLAFSVGVNFINFLQLVSVGQEYPFCWSLVLNGIPIWNIFGPDLIFDYPKRKSFTLDLVTKLLRHTSLLEVS